MDLSIFGILSKDKEIRRVLFEAQGQNCEMRPLRVKRAEDFSIIPIRLAFKCISESKCQRSSIREQPFLILGTRVEDFRKGYEIFFYYFVGVRKYQGIFLWSAKIFCLKDIYVK